METRERFNLRWDDFEANIKVTLRDVRDESEFFDVTLVGGDGKQVKANKVILAGGSAFFFNVLRENPHPHPLIYLKGVSHRQLLSLLDFLYTGEASIAEEDLNKFLDIAEDLKVKGLTPIGSQTKSNVSTPAPRQSQRAAEEASPSPRVYHHIPVYLQNQVAVKEAVSSPGMSHPRHDTTASLQSQSTVDESATTPKISRPLKVISTLQGEMATEEVVPSNKVSCLPSMAVSDRDNAFPQATFKENHVSTNNVKVEVGYAEHFNVGYGLNADGEQFIRHVSIRGLGVNKENIGYKSNISKAEVLDDSNFESTYRIGDLYEQSEECQSEGMELSEKQEKNYHIFLTGKKPKQEMMDYSTDGVISEALDNGKEHLNYDWYERGEENNRMMRAEPEEDGYFEQSILANVDGKQEIVDSNCDMDAADNVFINEQSTRHAHECSEDNYDDMIRDGEQDISRQKCYICAKSFATLHKLEKHKICHNGETQFQCVVCFKKFPNKTCLKQHKEMHDEKLFQCSICFKRFSRMRTLKEHNGIHTGENPYPCLQCSKKFSRPSHLKMHEKVHTGDKPYQCQICFKQFAVKSTLIRHNKTHTKEKQFKCLVCFKKFSRVDHLNKHKGIHTNGEKPNQ